MPQISSGKRYAQAIFELALEKGVPKSWQVELRKITDLAADREIMDLLENPKLPFDAKKGLLKKRLGSVDPLILNAACLLMDRGKLKIIGNISQHYGRLLDAHHGIEHAEVTTAVSLDDEVKKNLSTRFAEIVGQKVVIDARIDPAIIGGFTAKINDTLIDGSIRHRLASLKKCLLEAQYWE